ncbi:hypothetical Protein YC6258_00387 [Gynuella sunshinyii YC6258]|uniref:Uncharacterized protein n=1 Tax=Gynuella sunshinyii YC6258 TaxID=1445510 RepID=A0A0C5VG95_9GAMM|nr:hypothetical Protein YC6258_00387 [Gynuella sunshinyii YC6258]
MDRNISWIDYTHQSPLQWAKLSKSDHLLISRFCYPENNYQSTCHPTNPFFISPLCPVCFIMPSLIVKNPCKNLPPFMITLMIIIIDK